MHKLSPEFLNDLQTRILKPLLVRVHADHTLDLHIRNDSINVYYRGVSLVRVDRVRTDGYNFVFDANYFHGTPPVGVLATQPVRTLADCETWLRQVPLLKDTMDLWLGATKSQREREAQQVLVRENTRDDAIATATDYYIIDVEYSRAGAKADAVAVRWPSTSIERKRKDGHRLALIEVKFGDTAMKGSAGIHKHVADAEALASDSAALRAFQDEMLELFGQKIDLGLIRHRHKLASFERAQDPPIDLILVLANHDPSSGVLNDVLATLPAAPHVQVLIAAANHFGYGLYDDGMLSVAEYLARFGTTKAVYQSGDFASKEC